MSSGPNLLNTAQPLITDGVPLFNRPLKSFDIFPIIFKSQKRFSLSVPVLDFQLSPRSSLRFLSTPMHTHSNMHSSQRRPHREWEEVVYLICLSSPGDGLYLSGSRGLCPISPSTPHTSTQVWRACPHACVLRVCKNAFTYMHFIIRSTCA